MCLNERLTRFGLVIQPWQGRVLPLYYNRINYPTPNFISVRRIYWHTCQLFRMHPTRILCFPPCGFRAITFDLILFYQAPIKCWQVIRTLRQTISQNGLVYLFSVSPRVDSYLRFPFAITLYCITDETRLRSSRHLLLRHTQQSEESRLTISLCAILIVLFTCLKVDQQVPQALCFALLHATYQENTRHNKLDCVTDNCSKKFAACA